MTENKEKSNEDITFFCSPAKHGKYYIFHIPNKLIKNKLIDPEETYQLDLKPIKKILKGGA